jgi:hypothetical protein
LPSRRPGVHLSPQSWTMFGSKGTWLAFWYALAPAVFVPSGHDRPLDGDRHRILATSAGKSHVEARYNYGEAFIFLYSSVLPVESLVLISRSFSLRMVNVSFLSLPEGVLKATDSLSPITS